jgi:hypothetical protein
MHHAVQTREAVLLVADPCTKIGLGRVVSSAAKTHRLPRLVVGLLEIDRTLPFAETQALSPKT